MGTAPRHSPASVSTLLQQVARLPVLVFCPDQQPGDARFVFLGASGGVIVLPPSALAVSRARENVTGILVTVMLANMRLRGLEVHARGCRLTPALRMKWRLPPGVDRIKGDDTLFLGGNADVAHVVRGDHEMLVLNPCVLVRLHCPV